MERKSVSDDNIDANKEENDATQTLNDQKNDGTEIVVESSTHSTDGPSNKTVAEEPVTDVKGWLQKRTKGLLGMSYKWERQWFQLKGTELLYGENEQSLPKKIQLAGAEITESDIDNKTFAFGIKPKDSKRTYYIHAESEEEQQNWMQAICMAKLNKSGEGGACSVQ